MPWSFRQQSSGPGVLVERKPKWSSPCLFLSFCPAGSPKFILVLKPGPPGGANREQTLQPLPVSKSPSLGRRGGDPVGPEASPASLGTLYEHRPPSHTWSLDWVLFPSLLPSPSFPPSLIRSKEQLSNPLVNKAIQTEGFDLLHQSDLRRLETMVLHTVCSLSALLLVWRCCSGLRCWLLLGAEVEGRALSAGLLSVWLWDMAPRVFPGHTHSLCHCV